MTEKHVHRPLAPSAEEVERHVTHVLRVQAGYHRVKTRLLQVVVEHNSVGGQFTVRVLQLEEAEGLIARLAGKFFGASCANCGLRGIAPTCLADFAARDKEDWLKRNGKNYFLTDGPLRVFVRVWGQDERPEAAFRAQPPPVWFHHKTRRQRKWERKNLEHAKTTYKSQLYRFDRDSTFVLAVVGRYRTRPEVPYLQGFSEY